MKSYEGVVLQLHACVTWALDTGRWPMTCWLLYCGETVPVLYWTGGWVAPELVWLLWKRDKISCTYRVVNQHSSVFQPIA